jgi:chorismate dehydratase
LCSADPRIVVHLDHPSALAARLARGQIEVGLIPSVEYLRGMAAGLGYRIVPGVAIATQGPVRSVKLLSQVPLPEIDTLALDEGSRTSQALALVWLWEAQGIRPSRIEPLPIGASPLENRADAVLLIGDRAMTVPDDSYLQAVDLGQAWFELTGLPFVFAFWVTRPGFDALRLVELLRRCRDEGLARARGIADEAAPRLGLDPDFCHAYLTQNLSYALGAREIAGFRLFAGKAAALGLVPEGVPLVFAEDCLDPAARP